MYITDLYLKSFGKYNERRFSFNKGINIIYGNNEKGKSTLHKFIESMLFGLNTYQFGAPDYKEKYNHYLPWSNHNEFYGELDFVDKERKFHVEQDYLKERGVKVYMDERRIGPYKKSDDNSIIKSHEHKMLRVLGISDISSSTGTGMINEMQDKILNIKATNSGHISVEQAKDILLNKLDELESAPELLALTEQATYYKDELNRAEIKQRSNLGIMLDYYDTIDEIKVVQNEIDEINIKLSDYEAYDFIKKYQKLSDINVEIKDTELKKGAISEISGLSVEEVRQFVNDKGTLEILRNKLKNKEKAKQSIVNELKQYEDGFSKGQLEYCSDSMKQDYIRSQFRELDNIESRKASVGDDLHDVANRIGDVELKGIDSDEEVKAREIKLDEDYQRFLNTTSWKSRIMEEKEKSSSTLEVEQEIKKLTNRYLNLRIISLVMQISGSLMTLTMFAMPSYAFFLFFAILSCCIIILVTMVLRRSVDRQLIEQEFVLKNIQDEGRKSKNRLHKATLQLNDILDVYNANTEAEYIATYEERKAELRRINDLINENKISLNKSKEIKAEFDKILSAFIGELGFIEELDFFEEGNEFDYNKFKTFMFSLIESSETYKGICRDKDSVDQDIIEMQNKIKILEDTQLLFNGAALKIETMEDYQELREGYVKTSEQLEGLVRDKGNIIGEFSEEYILEYGKELIDSGNYRFEDAIYDVDEIRNIKNNKVNYKEELVIKSSKLKAESEHLSELSVPISRLTLKVDEYNEKLHVFHSEIELYKEALDYIESASAKVFDRFKDLLKDRLHAIIHQVIGEQYQISFDDEMKMVVKDIYTNEIVSIDSLSQGTIDQIYFALRIGLISSMEDNINIPLILDDCFVHYDGGRLEHMLAQVAKLDRQVIILTCHRREEEIFRNLDVDFNYVEL